MQAITTPPVLLCLYIYPANGGCRRLLLYSEPQLGSDIHFSLLVPGFHYLRLTNTFQKKLLSPSKSFGDYIRQLHPSYYVFKKMSRAVTLFPTQNARYQQHTASEYAMKSLPLFPLFFPLLSFLLLPESPYFYSGKKRLKTLP